MTVSIVLLSGGPLSGGIWLNSEEKKILERT